MKNPVRKRSIADITIEEHFFESPTEGRLQFRCWQTFRECCASIMSLIEGAEHGSLPRGCHSDSRQSLPDIPGEALSQCSKQVIPIVSGPMYAEDGGDEALVSDMVPNSTSRGSHAPRTNDSLVLTCKLEQ